METVVQPQDETELRLLLERDPAADRQWWRKAVPLSVATHGLIIAGLLFMPKDAAPVAPVARAVRVTPLVAPPTELTQKLPNKGKVSKEFNVEALRAIRWEWISGPTCCKFFPRSAAIGSR
ncbi:MAG: hypothetical protein HYX25_03990 [Candidatus Solibacter usitatus]|nr:hypothetical protein [Candidatus Solibacter usitatus]